MAKGDRITAARFNAIRATAVNVMGVGSGQTGYGQAVVSTSVNPGQSINSTIFNNLRTDMSKAYTHQTNGSVVNTPATTNQNPPNLEIATGSTTISDAILVQYENFVNNINTNRAIAAAAQLTDVNLTSTSRPTAWGGATDVISHTVTLTFNGYTQGGLTVSAADHARCFFNAGGFVRINASRTGGSSTSKNTTWTNMLNGFGTLAFRATSSTITGSLNPTGTVASTTGFFNLTVGGASTQILFQPGPSGVYAENDYNVRVSRPTANTLAFTIEFRDDDAGDQTGVGPPVDEEVDGTLTSTVAVTRPFGSFVDVPAPSGSATAL
jgi:hypothetical protein